MNISVIGLITSSMISTSPLFVSNNMMLSNCQFQKFTSLLFYNQRSLHINRANFQKGLDGIVIIDKAINQLFDSKFTNDSFYGEYYSFTNNIPLIQEQLIIPNDKKASYSMINCRFEQISVSSNPMIKFSSQTSSYFSDVLFFKCKGKDNLIKLDQSHCNTMTHICSFENTVESGADFCSSYFEKMDFFDIFNICWQLRIKKSIYY